jgi:HPt (histidine-containing phosphotransfer) domain-containing protein
MSTPGLLVDPEVIASLQELERASQHPLLAPLVEAFLSDASARIGAIWHALADSDRRALRLEAHGLKGSAAALGVAQVASVATRLETEADASSTTDLDATTRELAVALTRAEPVLRALAAGQNPPRITTSGH